MGVDVAAPGVGPILRFQPERAPAPEPGVHVVVLDTSWTPDPADDGTAEGLRDVAARALAERDLLAETAGLLDGWAVASGVIPTLSIEGTSFWYQGRVRHGLWLHERLLWLALVDERVRAIRPTAIECAWGCDDALVTVARSIAERDGVPIRIAPDPNPPVVPALDPAAVTVPGAHAGPPSLAQRLRRRLLGPRGPSESVRRRRFVADRLDQLSTSPGRLLVVLTHARQRVDTPTGPRWMNAYVGPVLDRLRGTTLEPIEVEVRSRLSDPAVWDRLSAADAAHILPGDVIWTAATGDDPEGLRERAEVVAATVERDAAPLLVAGVDLGPALAERVAGQVRESHPRNLQAVTRLRQIIRRLRPRLILMADEYHRQDWLTAARLEGIPTVAIQHGMIFRWHNGYMHRDRPDELAIVDRTYVFGDWERQLLTERSVYRPDEVRVGGSPRLDLTVTHDVDRDQVRGELGIAPGDRMVVVSGTWGPVYRRFHYPIALAGLMDRPLPRVHVVVKLHPGEPDEGPYRAVIEGVAAARGFAPPPMSIVQSVDLYRILRAADAHIGIQSTVLTEAVATGTLNLLAAGLAASDLLGYVEAGVAIPVRDGGDLLAALDAGPAAAASPAAREAFLERHFRPGSASDRIAGELLAWPA